MKKYQQQKEKARAAAIQWQHEQARHNSPAMNGNKHTPTSLYKGIE